MHPAHVAAFVAEEVAELEAQVATRPELAVRAVDLNGDTDLWVRVETQTSESASRAINVAGPVISQIPGMVGIAGGMEVPIIGTQRREEFVLRLDCSDYNSQPPLVVLCDADGHLLPDARWPHTGGQRGIVAGHPILGPRKFFCRPGTREFHTHPDHEDQPWDAVREERPLYLIVTGLLWDLTHRWTLR